MTISRNGSASSNDDRIPRRRVLLQLASLGTVSWFASVSTRADRPWVAQVQAGPFDCRADFDLSGYMDLLQELADLQTDLQETLGLEPKEAEIEVLIFGNRGAYQRFLEPRVPEGVNRPALYVQGGDSPGRVYAYRAGDLDVNIRHEGTHALLHAWLPFVPIWLDEGLAEYFEVTAADRPHRNPHLKEVQMARRLRWQPRLESLAAKRDMAEMGSREYRDSWAWAHFLLHGPPEVRTVFNKYLTDLAGGEPPGDLVQNLLQSVPDAEQRLGEHFRTWGRR